MAEEKKDEKKKENRKIIIELDLDVLDKPTERQIMPNCDIWEKEEDMSPEFAQMMESLRYVMIYLARCMNEGPEVKDNVMKRSIAIRSLLDEFFMNVNINGYLLWGILYETMGNCYMNLTGRNKVLDIIRQIQIRKFQMENQKRKQQERMYLT